MLTENKNFFPASFQAPLVLLSAEDSAAFQTLFFYILLIVVLLLVLGTLYRKSTARSLDPFLLKEKPAELFAIAMRQDESFDIAIMRRGADVTTWPYHGKCSKINRRTIVLETRLPAVPKKLVASKVQVNFQIVMAGRQLFLQFESSVTNAFDTNTGYALEVRIPRYVVQNQKRQFLRLELDPVFLGPVAAWPLKPFLPVPVHSNDLGSPKLGNNNKSHRNLRVIDISATGIGFRIAHYPAVLFKREMPFLFLISLKNLQTKSTLSLWLYTKVRYVFSPSALDETKLGANIEKWAYVQHGPNQGQIVWNKTGKEGEVPPLFSWILDVQNQSNLIRVARREAEREAAKEAQHAQERKDTDSEVSAAV